MHAYPATEVSGVRAHVGDEEGRVQAALVFRVGQADEPLPHHGWTHLAEHLALDGLDTVREGSVHTLTTTMLLGGEEDAVRADLLELARRLAEPPAGRLAVERRVLEAEEGGRAPAPEAVVLRTLLGARGAGVTAFEELGLRDVDALRLREHTTTWFTRGNARLVLSRPVDGLDGLALPAGSHRPASPAALVAAPAPPFAVDHPAGASGLAGLIGVRDPADRLLGAVLRRGAWDRLRGELGLAYDVRLRRLLVDGDRRLLFLGSDAQPNDAAKAATVLLELLDRCAAGDLDDAALERARATELEATQPDAMAGFSPSFLLALATATASLLGHPDPDMEQVRAELRACDRDAVVAAAARLRERVVVVAPQGADVGGLPRFRPPDAPDGARRYRARTLSRHDDAVDLSFGDGVLVAHFGDVRVGVRVAECAALVEDHGGAIHLVSAEGEVVDVDPADVRDGEALVRELRALVPADRHVGRDERTAAVEDAAGKRGLRAWMVGEAPGLLTAQLGTGEEVLYTAESAVGLRSGVLAVTDRRVLLAAKMLGEHLVDLPHGNICDITVKRNPLWPSLVVTTDAGSVRLGFNTIPRMREARRAIEEARRRHGGAARSAG